MYKLSVRSKIFIENVKFQRSTAIANRFDLVDILQRIHSLRALREEEETRIAILSSEYREQ